MPTLKKASKQGSSIRRISRERRKDIYNTSRWKSLRLSYIIKNPLCEICLALGKVTPAEDIHHKRSFNSYSGATRIYWAYNWDNLCALCKEHHSYLHRKGATNGLNIERIIEELK